MVGDTLALVWSGDLPVDRNLRVPARYNNPQALSPATHQGYDAVNGLNQLPLCHAPHIAVPQGELLAADPHSCGGVLPEVFHEVPGAHLGRGTEDD